MTDKKFLGIDYGLKRIGIAISDPLGISSAPFGFIKRESDEQAANIILSIASKEAVNGLVIGLPLLESGASGTNVEWVKNFQKIIKQKSDLPIYEADERYTSSEAEEILKSEGKWPAKPGELDSKAAAILLQRHLSSFEGHH